MSLISKQYGRSAVVFAITVDNQVLPAKVLKKSFYGTYNVKFYGNKTDQFLPQYRILPFTEENINNVTVTNKKDKKLKKNIKTAQKDHERYLKAGDKVFDEGFMKQVKEEEDEVSELIQNKHIERQLLSKVDAVENIPLEDLILDLKKNDGTTYISFQHPTKVREIVTQDTKLLILKRMEWAFLDIKYGEKQIQAEKTIRKIFNSEVLGPLDFVCSSLFNTITNFEKTPATNSQGGKKKGNKKGTSVFKKFLMGKRQIILKGMESYLSNYTVFLRAEEKFSSIYQQLLEKTE